MTTLITEQIEKKLRNNRLLDLPVFWSNELIFPYYDGLSLRNVPHTITQMLGAPFSNNSSLLSNIWQDDVPQAKRVVLFLMDGMGYKHLQMLMESDTEIRQVVADLNAGRDLIPLTSVVPSTTVVALTTLWTGATPAESGMSGTLMFLRELSMLTNMLSFSPLFGKHPQDVIASWGVSQEDIVKVAGIGEHLAEYNIPIYTVTNKSYIGSGLSRILHRGSEHLVSHKGYSDMMLKVAHLLQKTRNESCYISIYWSAVDALAHEYGAHTKYTHAEIRRQLFALRDIINKPSAKDGQTLFMLLADHGHYDATTIIGLAQDEVIKQAMQMSISGDERHGYLFLRHGTLDIVKNHIQETYPESLTCIDTQTALQAGYFGENVSPAITHRIGDLILIPRQGYILGDPVLGTLPMISRHAGLSDWEMLIPFIWQLL